MGKPDRIKLDDLKWKPIKIISPPFIIFLEGDKVAGMLFDKVPSKSIKEPIKQKRENCFLKFLKNGKMKIKLV